MSLMILLGPRVAACEGRAQGRGRVHSSAGNEYSWCKALLKRGTRDFQHRRSQKITEDPAHQLHGIEPGVSDLVQRVRDLELCERKEAGRTGGPFHPRRTWNPTGAARTAEAGSSSGMTWSSSTFFTSHLSLSRLNALLFGARMVTLAPPLTAASSALSSPAQRAPRQRRNGVKGSLQRVPPRKALGCHESECIPTQDHGSKEMTHA